MTRLGRRELLQRAMLLALAGSSNGHANAAPWPVAELAEACRVAYPALTVPVTLRLLWRQTVPAALPALLRRQIAADFAGGRVRDIVGWRLSETECLFALWLDSQ